MTKKYVRDFGSARAGDTENSGAAVNAAARAGVCERCGRDGYAALRVFLRVDDQPAETVCFKKQCVYCGHIPAWRGQSKDGAVKTFPAMYMPYSTGSGVSVKYRDFFVPLELYKTPDGKCDVAQKARIAAAVTRLAAAYPNRSEFSLVEVMKECGNKNL